MLKHSYLCLTSPPTILISLCDEKTGFKSCNADQEDTGIIPLLPTVVKFMYTPVAVYSLYFPLLFVEN